MSITIEDVVALQHEHLRTIGTKLIFLSIRSKAKEDGWATVSLAELARMTSLTRRGIVKTLKRMQGCGLLEIKHDHTRTDSKNLYRTIEL